MGEAPFLRVLRPLRGQQAPFLKGRVTVTFSVTSVTAVILSVTLFPLQIHQVVAKLGRYETRYIRYRAKIR